MEMIPIKKEQKKRTITEQNIYTQELIEVLKIIKKEQTISYNELSKTIGIDIRPGYAGYGYQYSARKILEREDNIVFEAVAKVGLRRLTSEEIATGTGSVYLRKKRSLIKRSKSRIRTIDDHYDDLSNEAKMQVTAHRTILAFDNELSKLKNILKIKNKIEKDNKLIGFKDTIKLFEK